MLHKQSRFKSILYEVKELPKSKVLLIATCIKTLNKSVIVFINDA